MNSTETAQRLTRMLASHFYTMIAFTERSTALHITHAPKDGFADLLAQARAGLKDAPFAPDGWLIIRHDGRIMAQAGYVPTKYPPYRLYSEPAPDSNLGDYDRGWLDCGGAYSIALLEKAALAVEVDGRSWRIEYTPKRVTVRRGRPVEYGPRSWRG